MFQKQYFEQALMRRGEHKQPLGGARPVAYAGFLKGGATKFRKFENNDDQNKNVPAQNQVRFPAQTLVKTKKKVFPSNLVRFLAQN